MRLVGLTRRKVTANGRIGVSVRTALRGEIRQGAGRILVLRSLERAGHFLLGLRPASIARFAEFVGKRIWGNLNPFRFAETGGIARSVGAGKGWAAMKILLPFVIFCVIGT